MTEKIRQRNFSRVSGTKLTVYAGVFVALGVLLPYVTAHAFGLKGNVFLPMHIPVLLCGFICGAKRGFLCAILTVSTSCFLTSMPALYPMLPIMAAELAMYGLMSGFLFGRGLGAIPSMLISMTAGRICYGIVFYILLLSDPALKLGPNPLIASMPVLSALMLGIPGIILQLVLVPIMLKWLAIKGGIRS